MSHLYLETEIRFIPSRNVSELANILEIGSSWKDVMSLIPASPWIPGQDIPHCDYAKKYLAEDISLIARECRKERRTGLEVLIDEWGTTGVKRPTVGDLVALLRLSKQIRAADLLLSLVYGPPDEKDSGEYTHNLHQEEDEGGEDSTNITKIFQHLGDINSGNTPHIPYADLSNMTKCFMERNTHEGGVMVGKGAFAVVFRGEWRRASQTRTVAVKKFQQTDQKAERQFVAEVEILSRCEHENIIKLEGFSCDGPHMCLLYEFMVNGSLFDRLSCLNGTVALTWAQRMVMTVQIAEGITYLHTNFSPAIIHRDIKSANILLDSQFLPKIGDFGIVRFGSEDTKSQCTTTAFGTSQYMAPETFYGDISVKMDTFSYAIVLLEILTGLAPYDENRENYGLLTHVTEYEEDIVNLMDANLLEYDETEARGLFQLVESGTEKKKKRPTMEQMLSQIHTLLHHFI